MYYCNNGEYFIMLQNEQGGIILSGCGTSGRLAFITAVSVLYKSVLIVTPTT